MKTKTFDKQEYNKLCAEFLGAIYSEQAKAWGFGNAKNIGSKMFHGVMFHNIIQAERFEKELNFHSDWNLIHNIVEQIENLEEGVDVEHNWYVTIGEGAYCRIFTDEFKTFQDEIVVNGDTKKQSAVLAIWEFLNYYKEIKK